MFNLFKDRLKITSSDDKVLISVEELTTCSLIKDLVREKLSSKLKLYIIDSGSCNGCELELQLLFSPLYDLSSYGVEVTYDVSEADVLLITGLMTENIYATLEVTLKYRKEASSVIMIGDCPVYKTASTTAFRDTFALKGQVLKIFPKAYHIAGCPPEPFTLLNGIHQFLKKL